MKARFANIDVAAAVRELHGLIGLRITNVYDADHKVYLFKFAKPDGKVLLLVESGIRIHTTDFDWPKNPAPSSFAMKLRKHVKNRRLESIRQLGVDRIVDMQFGSREAAYHVILELYDRGNIVLTDFEYNVLNILRVRTDQDTDVRFAVHEKYPVNLANQWSPPGENELRNMIVGLTGKEQLRKLMNSKVFYGSAVVDHALAFVGLPGNLKISSESPINEIVPKMVAAMQVADNIYKEVSTTVAKGYITYKLEKKLEDGKETECEVYQEFHPFSFLQTKETPFVEKSTFLTAVDEFYSKLESQKLDMGVMEQQKQALKKLENVQRDHERRLDALRRTQKKEKLQARLIEENVDVVDKIIVYMRTIMASELSWQDIAELLERRRTRGDEIAERVIKADIATNTLTIVLENRREESEEDDDNNAEDDLTGDVIKVDIDLNLSAFQNVTRLHSVKKQAALKEHKTIEASEVALRNAEKRTKQALKDVASMATISRARKTQWFEKFFWFISSDGFLVIGGRDAQQNEILVRRYLKKHDFYVHADLHGASSVVVKNPAGVPAPPKALNEAGVMAVCYSSAWEAKIPCRAWWVYSHQVTKTAPTGEYLGTGSFMIRGRKNFLTDTAMIMGFGILFKIDDDSVKNHSGDQAVEDEKSSVGGESAPSEEIFLEQEVESENDEEEKEDNADAAAEADAGSQNLLRALASRILSTGDDNEENTLITATSSGIVPTVPKPKPKPESKQVHFATVDGKNVNTIATNKNTKSAAAAEAQKNTKTVDSDDDWSDYKKKKGKKVPRPPKKTQKHQELPTKMKKEKKPDSKQEVLDEQDNAEENVDVGELESTAEVAISDSIVEVPDQSQKDEKIVAKSDEVPEQDDADDDEDDAAKNVIEDVEILKTFVGNPLPEDSLLFGIPVCMPYMVMQNYKLKIKLLPGTAKRGKVAKTCFQLFLKDRQLTTQEKDILKAIKDQDFSRNFPGSVKVAVQQKQMQQMKQRKK